MNMQSPVNIDIGEVLEALTEGVAVFDAKHHLVASNSRYAALDPGSNKDKMVQVREHRTPSGEVIDLRTDVTELQRRDRAFSVLLDKGSINPKFMEAAVEALATGLGYKWAGIGHFTHNSRGVQLEAYWNVDHVDEPFAYMLEGTPCDSVLEQSGFCYFPTDIDKLYPKDLMFVEMGIKAYQGTVVFGIDGRPLGHIFAFHDVADKNTVGQKEFLRVIADWVSLEFRRRHAEEQKEAAEKELRQHQKMEAIGRLAGGIAHEINTPIQYIGDNLRFLQDAKSGLDKVFDSFRALEEAVGRKGILIDELNHLKAVAKEVDLDYLFEECPRAITQSLSGIDQVSSIVSAMKEFSHPSNIKKGLVDINRVLENTLAVSRSEWRIIADIKNEFDEKLPSVMGMASELGQVFLNIIVNAAHSIRDAKHSDLGTITLRTRHKNNMVEIDIEDNGTGIAEDIRERIFDPFFTTKEVGQGTGQGLALAQDIIARKHGGTISFTTELGKGTCFTVRLPLDEGKE